MGAAFGLCLAGHRSDITWLGRTHRCRARNSSNTCVNPRELIERQTTLRGNEIRTAITIFLHGWLHGILGPSGIESAPCLILDTRLADHHTSRALQLPKRDVPFFSLEELLDGDALQVFFEICYPKREVLNIPNDYEAYRLFLKKSWGFEDFRPGTQRPAIEMLIDNDRDILRAIAESW